MKVMVRYSFPFLVTGVLQYLFWTVDLFVVGRFDNASYISAVAVGGQLMQVLTAVLMGFSMGGVLLIQRSMQEKNPRRAADGAGTLIFLAILAGVILTVVTALGSGLLAWCFQVPRLGIKPAREYLFIMALGIPFLVYSLCLTAILRGTGDFAAPILFLGLGILLNVILDFILVGALDLGSTGAAIASVIARIAEAAFGWKYVHDRGLRIPLTRKRVRLQIPVAVRIFQGGWALALRDGLVGFAFLLVLVILNRRGMESSAAAAVSEKILEVFLLPAAALGHGANHILSGQRLAGNYKDWYRILGTAIGVGALVAMAGWVLCQLLPETMIGLFSPDIDVIHMGGQYLKSCSFVLVPVCIITGCNGFLSVTGRDHVILVHTLLGSYAIRLPITWLASRLPGGSLQPVGWAAPMAALFSVIVCLWVLFFYQQNWQEPPSS